jgi:hypothetical protein
MKRPSKFLTSLLWLLPTVVTAYLIDLWVAGFLDRILVSPNLIFLDLWLGVIGRLGVAISLLLLFWYVVWRGERSRGSSLLLLVVGAAGMLYPLVLNVLILQGIMGQPAFAYAFESLTGYTATLLAGIGILGFVIERGGGKQGVEVDK